MHEFSIIKNIIGEIERVALENRLCRVNDVFLQVGQLRQVVPDFMVFAFNEVCSGTVAKGATLHIEWVPVTVRCRDCLQTFNPQDNVFVCDRCQSANLDTLKGKEIILRSVYGETS